MNPVFADWQGFFSAEVGAAAALAGLVAVAISINLSRILSFPYLPARAGENLFLLTAVFVLASLALIPGSSPKAFGAETLAVALAGFVSSTWAQARAFFTADSPSRGKKVARAVVALAALAALTVGGVTLVAGETAGLYWVAAGILVALASGVWNAWILMVEILR